MRDWVEGEDYLEAADAGGAVTARFRAGGAWAVLSEGGLEEPGVYETDGTVVAEHPGLRLHGFQFTPDPATLPDAAERLRRASRRRRRPARAGSRAGA